MSVIEVATVQMGPPPATAINGSKIRLTEPNVAKLTADPKAPSSAGRPASARFSRVHSLCRLLQPFREALIAMARDETLGAKLNTFPGCRSLFSRPTYKTVRPAEHPALERKAG